MSVVIVIIANLIQAMKKTIKKNVVAEPTYTVDFTDYRSVEEPGLALISAKVNSKTAITSDDVVTILDLGAKMGVNSFLRSLTEVKVTKKLPWYKRLWNWITGKNK